MDKLKKILIGAFVYSSCRDFQSEHIDDTTSEILSLFEALIKEELLKVPSDKQIKEYTLNTKYADAYYQGKFDTLMNLLRILNKEK